MFRPLSSRASIGFDNNTDVLRLNLSSSPLVAVASTFLRLSWLDDSDSAVSHADAGDGPATFAGCTARTLQYSFTTYSVLWY
uniref:Uncharacterized protein LOC105647312 isoform X2 n=1 Tax=Rhizophora mucronata TaxID=61149 RepID=A0A2P2KSH8_RHIMU